MALFITVLILILTLVIGVPVPFCFGASVIFIVYSMGYQSDFLLSTGYGQLSSVVILAVPLFVMSGAVMEKGKIGDALVNLVEKFVGRFKGGLGAASTIASAIFGSISGSAFATLSCIGSIMAPRMKKARYPQGIYAALLANAAPLGLLIPPSAIQILYAWSSGQSVLACFLATAIPGIILTFMLCVVHYFIIRKYDVDIAEKETPAEWTTDLVRKTGSAVPALLMPVIILGGIYSGIMTPTEAAAVSVIYAIPVSFFVYKHMTPKGLKEALIDSASTTGVVMVMFFMVMMLSRMFVLESLPQKIIEGLMSVSSNKYIILIMINIFMVIIGMLMDDVSGVLLCTPILLPLAQKIGIHPVHFAAILGVNLGMGNVTPPTAPLLYLSVRVCNSKINEMLKPSLAFLVFAWLPTLVLTTYIPEIALMLPKALLPKLFM